MTARCLGATSSNRPEFGRFIYMAPAQVGALLNNIPTPWAVYFAGTIGSITYDLSTFCSTDPPDDPGMGLTDWVALMNPGTLEASITAQSKFRQWLGHYLWDHFCKCDDGTTPTPYTPPTAPTGLPPINDPGTAPTYPTGTACQTFTHSGVAHNGDANTVLGKYPLNGATYATIDFSSPTTHTTSGQFGFDLRWYNAAGTLLSGTLFGGVSTSGDFTHVVGAAPSGATQFDFVYGPSGALVPSPLTWTAITNLYCGTTPDAPAGPVPTPCPADPFVQIALDQILALVTLIQRQNVPFAYIFGADHGGLSGSGHIDVQGLLGCKVTLDSIGGGTGTELADPDEVFEAGWITWGNADGSTKREWISHSPFVSLPAAAGQYTRIGYTLRAGVSATITELVREP
jgi:hypothetical protein